MSKKANPIIQSWNINAKKWIKTIENSEIESRQLVTNAAILENVLQRKPKSVLDIGCGEGWLVNTLAKYGIAASGIDAIPTLIKNAKTKGKGRFKVLTYDTLTKGATFKQAPFELITINFALFENRKTKQLIKKLPSYLTADGQIIIQTLHPFSIAKDIRYESAWRKDSWEGLKRNFQQPHKWYYRTLEDWIKLFRKAKLNLLELQEPIHPKTGRPASVVFVLAGASR